MNWSLPVLAIGTALAVASPAPAQAGVIIDYAESHALPAGNDFSSALAGLGLARYAAAANLMLDAPGTISFEFLGSESGLSDSFKAPGIAFTETSAFEDRFASPIALGSSAFSAGSLAGLLEFLSAGGRTAAPGTDGLAIFLDPGHVSGQPVSTFYLGFDDLTGGDDDFDDLVIRGVYFPAVPEPGTWAMMILGFGAIGAFLRYGRARQTIRRA